ncbi:phytoene/squalene synthase family protein [Sediminibacterium ginsengisoli]|uniref:Phytoene/squalene synthetase n=1 Tax=Sediminibacterium ginsengisoli TaxID=413434 RepID=A0A1T4JUP0_9BACT|nr:phytoene/squalene synthase family protein [Sediminibacterium ginsengisoli]SJZ33930.1 Phytoene/squalene synthetase [Sediminibacterium ginsengisoli]
MISLFHDISQRCSEIVTDRYSTSFSAAIRLLHKDMRGPIRNIYGFVRLADEIVDSFHDYDKSSLLNEFRQATYDAIEKKISLNPILHSFQLTFHAYNMNIKLVEAFLHSMEMDLVRRDYNRAGYEEYIYGSAEVVGLMCLYVFCNGDEVVYNSLTPYARSLGASFQKVNFLRDIRADYEGLDRIYFPGCDFRNFTEKEKAEIEKDIEKDFKEAYQGIRRLPVRARFGVYVAYRYYYLLFSKIKKARASQIMEQRFRVPDYRKALIWVQAGLEMRLNMI